MIRLLRLSMAATLLLAIAAVTASAQNNPSIAMIGKWTGTFRPVLLTQDIRNAGGDIGRMSGNVELQPVHESGQDFYNVLIQVSTNVAGQTLEWGVSMGRCGSKLIMLEHANQLPAFETRPGGEGEMRHQVALPMDANHTYQVGLFRNGHAQQNMVACANLKYDDRMR